MSFIVADEIVKTYGSGQAEVTAVRGMSFQIEKGEFVAVMGPSGSGKSTLLSIMGGLNSPSQGSYQVDGMDIYSMSSDQRADFRRDYLGFVFQNFHLVNYLSILENLMLPLVTRKMKTRDKESLARMALDRVGLGDKADRLPGQISGGEQERTAVARALVNRPPILLADEPTGNLDQATSLDLMELLSDLHHDGMTIVMVTHSRECAEFAQNKIEVADGLIKPSLFPSETKTTIPLEAVLRT